MTSQYSPQNPVTTMLSRIVDRAFDSNDECRYCQADYEDGHAEDCPAEMAQSALASAFEPLFSAPEPTREELLEALRWNRARWQTMGGPWSGPAIHHIDEVLDPSSRWLCSHGQPLGVDCGACYADAEEST
jgi:hypothetical protein